MACEPEYNLQINDFKQKTNLLTNTLIVIPINKAKMISCDFVKYLSFSKTLIKINLIQE